MFDVLCVQLNHSLKPKGVPCADLPKPRAPWNCLQPPPMVGLILFNLIWKRRPRSHKTHLSSKYIPELRQLVKAGRPKHLPHLGDSEIVGQLVDLRRGVPSKTRGSVAIALDQRFDELLMHTGIAVVIHGTKLVHDERPEIPSFPSRDWPSAQSDPFLLEERRAWGIQLDQKGDEKTKR